jgi:hypothetical protein
MTERELRPLGLRAQQVGEGLLAAALLPPALLLNKAAWMPAHVEAVQRRGIRRTQRKHRHVQRPTTDILVPLALVKNRNGETIVRSSIAKFSDTITTFIWPLGPAYKRSRHTGWNTGKPRSPDPEAMRRRPRGSRFYFCGRVHGPCVGMERHLPHVSVLARVPGRIVDAEHGGSFIYCTFVERAPQPRAI